MVDPCSISTDTANYNILLGSSQDNQCIDGHGGALCTGCHQYMEHYVQCVDDECAEWHPYALLLICY